MSTAVMMGQSIAAAIDGVSLDWEAVRRSAGDIAEGLRSLSDFCGGLDSAMEQLREAVSQFSDLSGETEDALAVLADAMDTFEDAARDMGDTADQVHALFDDLSHRDPIEFDKLGDDFHQAEDDLHGAVNSLGDQMDLLREEMNTTGDTLSGDIRDLGDQFQVIADLILDAFSDAKDLDEDDLWSDVSEERINNTTLGKARSCNNLSAVEGDLNVGGITGAMTIEYDFDPEDDITEVGEESVDFRYETRAILQECVNKGPVTSKKDAAGGAVGRMELGYVLACENYGAIESAGGDYAGGIAGYGCEIYQCVSLVSVEESEGYAGSVAGEWDREDGTLKGNRFVDGPLAGVDGISYAGKAEPVAYETLIREEGVPRPFHSLTVTYVVEDEVLETVSYAYGQVLSAGSIPAVPEKSGYYGVWEEIGESRITMDHVVEAIYTPYTTTLASDIMRDGVHPVLLMEDRFDRQAVMEVRQTAGADNTEQWTVTLSGTDEGEHRVRFTPPAEWEDLTLSLLTESGRVPLRWDWEGSCCVFTAGGVSFTIEAARQGVSSTLLWAVLAVGGFAVLLLGFFVLRRRRAGKRHGAAVSEDAGR